MSFQTPITINEAIENIHRKKYLLPSIQRELVWDTDQMELLFDSLMRDYPISSFLFWYVEKDRIDDYQFYEFIRDYHERNTKHNPKANINGENDIISILDGQQRLTSLYIGLKGTYAYRMPRKRYDNPLSYPERKLYLNLLSPSNDINKKYDFLFLSSEEANEINENTYWFKVGDILDLQKEHEVNNYLIRNDLMKYGDKSIFANETLFKLHSVIFKNQIINYYLEKDNSLDKVLNIFIRVNSGGTTLSYSDLLLSIATAQWQEKDAREEIYKFVDDINSIGDGFNFNKDFVLKACLLLSDFTDIAFKVDNFNRQNMLTIENKWEEITGSIRTAVYLLESYGFNRETLTSNISVLPMCYYVFKRGLPHNFVQSRDFKEDREKIKNWLIIALLKRVFGGQPDNVLRPIRKIISEDHLIFPYEKIVDALKGTPKTFAFNDDEIENLYYYYYGQAYTFSTLALLYPSLDYRNKFHIDHIFPKSFFSRNKLLKKGVSSDKIDFYLSNYNYLANLQLLEGIPNQEKSDTDFKEWFNKVNQTEQEKRDYMAKHMIPDVDIEITNFDVFIEKRTEIMREKYKSILKEKIVRIAYK
jgi:uncharacterized protein with ParB-like and HNH nuclease domain